MEGGGCYYCEQLKMEYIYIYFQMTSSQILYSFQIWQSKNLYEITWTCYCAWNNLHKISFFLDHDIC
jgi:hypothetical protein